jgi:4-amino-4-deoxy-L-arabinose transferase-like glycosyltransferase
MSTHAPAQQPVSLTATLPAQPPVSPSARRLLAVSPAAVAVLLLTLLALAVRLNGLDWRDGDLSTDEARLVLAANGVLATGLPILPSERLYTRGLVTIYATAPSIAIFGVHDWSARLPGIVTGALLVPAVFLLARSVAGTGPALAAAVLAIFAAPLVAWSRQAWPPMTFLLLFTLAAYAGYRGFGQDEGRWQVLAGLGFLLTMLAYELAMILPAGVGLYLAGRAARRDLGWWRGHSTVAALALAVLAVCLLAAFGLALRAGTLAGADSEFRHYFTPELKLSGLGYYWRQVWGDSAPLLLLVPAGLLWCRLDDRPVPPGLGYLLALLAVAFLVPTLVIQSKQEVQYGLAVLPLVAALGSWGIAALAAGVPPTPQPPPITPTMGPRIPTACEGEGEATDESRRAPLPRARGRGWGWGPSRGWAWGPPVLAVLAFGLVVWGDAAGALRPRVPSRAPNWLDDLRAKGFQPDDPNALVLAEAPLVTQLYLGRADFYVHPEGYERYAYQDGLVARSLYTPAVLLKEAGDFERLVAGPYAGRTLWVIGQDDRLPRLTRQMDPALWQRLQSASGVTRPTRDSWIMRVELPR